MNELDRRLRAAGEAPVPPPDSAFATMLEDRLRAGMLAPEPVLRPAPRPTRRDWFPAAAVAAATTSGPTGMVATMKLEARYKGDTAKLQ